MATWEQLNQTYGTAVINSLPPWMANAPDLASAFLYEMIDVQGDSPDAANNALETIRIAPQYQAMYDYYFAGNRRPDGTLRLDENQYLSRKQGYRDAILAVNPNMNPEVFEDEFSMLIEGGVDESEFGRRVDALYTRVLTQGPDIREYYGANFGISMTDEGILASLMSPRVQDAVLAKQLTMAEIGGEASMRNYDITTDFVNLLEQAGMDREEAQRMFGSADRMLPVLSNLAARHGDPDDTFDITEFAGAAALGDAEQIMRIERLQAQESSLFTGGAQVDIVRSRAGGVTGLLDT